MTAGGAVPNVYQADVSCRAVVFAKPWAGFRACCRKRPGKEHGGNIAAWPNGLV